MPGLRRPMAPGERGLRPEVESADLRPLLPALGGMDAGTHRAAKARSRLLQGGRDEHQSNVKHLRVAKLASRSAWDREIGSANLSTQTKPAPERRA